MSALGRLRLAVSFLTRIPVGAPEASPADVGRSLALFPVVGLVLGGALAALARLLESRLPEEVLAALLVAALAALTGALHLDGVADVFDGLGGGRGDRERTLALMRDSRIGGHGATALVLAVIAKVSTLAAVLPAGNLRVLVVFPAIGRWLAVLLVVVYPYARSEGLGRAFTEHAGARELALATAVTAIAAAWTGAGAIAAAGAAALAALAFGAWLTRRLGGLTGDAYGAAVELGEVAFLVAWLAGG
ncbi:MAG TPA: adenosylcobinamide-GDP ribazoletransferase [Candidatus Binatia bacterium]|nr:adenosylcobinamide-GDP ribazoletransferase [Candidatus Binatia bacterium]